MGPGQRTDHYLRIPAGSLLFFYTDGLIESRGSDIDAGTERLLRLIDTFRDDTPRQIFDAVIDEVADGAHDDDTVAFAVRIPTEAAR